MGALFSSCAIVTLVYILIPWRGVHTVQAAPFEVSPPGSWPPRLSTLAVVRETAKGSGEWLFWSEAGEVRASRIRQFGWGQFPAEWEGDGPIVRCVQSGAESAGIVDRSSWHRAIGPLFELDRSGERSLVGPRIFVEPTGLVSLNGHPLPTGGDEGLSIAGCRTDAGEQLVAAVTGTKVQRARKQYHFGGGADRVEPPYYVDVFRLDDGQRVGSRVKLMCPDVPIVSLKVGWLDERGTLIVYDASDGVRYLWPIPRTVWEPSKEKP